VRLRVRNLGKTGRIYVAGDQVLVDSGGGRRRHNFGAALTSGLPNPNGAYLDRGASAKAALVFDLPDGREAARLEVHGRSGDRGETIPLP
jgi:hypothetical protein